jgi:hypothetical protein
MPALAPVMRASTGQRGQLRGTIEYMTAEKKSQSIPIPELLREMRCTAVRYDMMERGVVCPGADTVAALSRSDGLRRTNK